LGASLFADPRKLRDASYQLRNASTPVSFRGKSNGHRPVVNLTPGLHFRRCCALSGRPFLALTHPAIECGDLRRGKAQAELGTAPNHVLGRAGPLMLDEIAHLGL